MRTAFNARLTALDDQVVDMTRQVRAAIRTATTALLEADLGLAESVIEGDADLNALAKQVEDRAARLLAQQQPVAHDLRFLMAAMRNASALERMGDLAVHVAKTARLRYPTSVVPQELRGVIVDMGTVAVRMITQTGVALARRDVVVAQSLPEMDREMDRLHREMFIIVLSPGWEYGVQAAVDVTLVSRYYERFADHAVTIGDRLVQVMTDSIAGRSIPPQLDGPVNPR